MKTMFLLFFGLLSTVIALRAQRAGEGAPVPVAAAVAPEGPTTDAREAWTFEMVVAAEARHLAKERSGRGRFDRFSSERISNERFQARAGTTLDAATLDDVRRPYLSAQRTHLEVAEGLMAEALAELERDWREWLVVVPEDEPIPPCPAYVGRYFHKSKVSRPGWHGWAVFDSASYPALDEVLQGLTGLHHDELNAAIARDPNSSREFFVTPTVCQGCDVTGDPATDTTTLAPAGGFDSQTCVWIPPFLGDESCFAYPPCAGTATSITLHAKLDIFGGESGWGPDDCVHSLGTTPCDERTCHVEVVLYYWVEDNSLNKKCLILSQANEVDIHYRLDDGGLDLYCQDNDWCEWGSICCVGTSDADYCEICADDDDYDCASSTRYRALLQIQADNITGTTVYSPILELNVYPECAECE